jgi:hypothetical protein
VNLAGILSGHDTEPGATVFNVFASTLEKVHEPMFAPIEFSSTLPRDERAWLCPG